MGQLFIRKPSRHVTSENRTAHQNRCVAEQLEPRRMLAAAPPAAYGSTIQLNAVDRTHGTGSDPVGVATGFFRDPDLEKYGAFYPDIVTTNANGKAGKLYNSISVFLGDTGGDGYYDVGGDTQLWSGGVDPQAVAVGDLN